MATVVRGRVEALQPLQELLLQQRGIAQQALVPMVDQQLDQQGALIATA